MCMVATVLLPYNQNLSEKNKIKKSVRPLVIWLYSLTDFLIFDDFLKSNRNYPITTSTV